MGDDDQRRAAPVQRPEQVGQFRGRRGVQVSRRLVAQQQRGMVDQGPGDRDPLPLAPGQRRGQGVRPVRQADLGQRGHRRGQPAPPRQVGVDLRQHDVLRGCPVRQQVERLEDEPDAVRAHGRPVPLGRRADIDAVDLERALCRPVEQAKQVQQG
jgi:hypothetical protein